ncbi:hypothetical protein OE88DRAFT_1664792 [Heliocybe sulcata]|uniref:Uncharacterized protein n=1 Tax=Heliocybe sulcata TaxID=5364 RepID=A0A5C3MSC6_9AGAM|nr:hypothetical protein OE88DRAFT_1664792 [Heliocybe sulcata]
MPRIIDSDTSDEETGDNGVQDWAAYVKVTSAPDPQATATKGTPGAQPTKTVSGKTKFNKSSGGKDKSGQATKKPASGSAKPSEGTASSKKVDAPSATGRQKKHV